MSHNMIEKNVFYVGVDDRKTYLFENLWPIPYGISYNAYLIKDDKNALIEGGVKADFSRQFLRNLSNQINLSDLDFIVINHMEPDHTGTLPILYELAPNAKIITTAMGKKMIDDFYGIKDEDRIVVVKDKDSINLGNTELEFYQTPWVHWPETMMTYEKKYKILFSGDVFGTFGALNGKLFDDEVDLNIFLNEAKRYFINIIGKYTTPAKNAIKKVSNLDIKIIAPSHGPIWRSNLSKIIDIYKELAEGEAKWNKGTLIYATMYGFNEELVQAITRGLSKRGIEIKVYNVINTHVSYILTDVWDSKFVIIGTPTYDGGVFPQIQYVVHLIEKKQIKNKYYGLFGTSGWSGMGYKQLQGVLEKLGWELVEPIIETRGRMRGREIELIKEFAENISKAINHDSCGCE